MRGGRSGGDVAAFVLVWHTLCFSRRMAPKRNAVASASVRPDLPRKTHKVHECGTHDERVPPAVARHWDRTLADEITLEVGSALEGAGPFLIAGARAIGPATRST